MTQHIWQTLNIGILECVSVLECKCHLSNSQSTECHREVPVVVANRQLYNQHPHIPPRALNPDCATQVTSQRFMHIHTKEMTWEQLHFFNSSNPQGSFKDTKNAFLCHFFFFFAATGILIETMGINWTCAKPEIDAFLGITLDLTKIKWCLFKDSLWKTFLIKKSNRIILSFHISPSEI